MKFCIRTLLVVACLSGGITATTTGFARDNDDSSVKGPKLLHGEITKVTDGDTVHFRDDESDRDSKDLTIRMVSIDAPETHFPTPRHGTVGQKPFGEIAGQYLEHLIPVGTKADLLSFGVDKYRRILGVVLLDKKDVNLKMVREGQAVPYIICDGPRCNSTFFKREHSESYLKACELARSEGKGIWSTKHPLKELPYMFRLRMSERQPDKFIGDFKTRKLYEPTEFKKVDICSRIFFMKEAAAQKIGFEYE